MKSTSTYYTDLIALKSFISDEGIMNSSTLLIQVFTAKNDRTYIEQLLKNVTMVLPDAVIIGSTTDGEIMSGKVSTNSTVLNFTSFEHTTLKIKIVKHKENGYFSGQYIAKELIEDDTKLIISFADGLHTNGQSFLEGMHDVDERVMIAGGLAGDNATFTKTFVFTKDTIITKGAVAVALNSQVLAVHNEHSFNWHRIGKALTITKVEGNRVYMIDDRTAVETYMHYLGKEIYEGLPAVGIEFPLIMVRDGMDVARAVLSKHDDGSLSFAGNFTLGDKVQFGYGDPQEILQCSQEVVASMEQKDPEAIFVYSCMARRHFMPDEIELETLALNNISPVSGFFTYGEFFTSSKKELLNQSITLVALSEKSRQIEHKKIQIPVNKIVCNSSINALINLLNITSTETMDQAILIQTQSMFETLFNSSPDGILLIENNRFIECNQKMLDIFEYTFKDKFLNARVWDLASRYQPDGTHSAAKMKKMYQLAVKNGSHQFEWAYKKENGQTSWIDIMMSGIELNDRNIMYVVCRDIAERKTMELELENQRNILYHQAHYDALTELPNRTLFMEELKKSLLDMEDSKDELALIFLDLDRFKTINDSLGHAIGDDFIYAIGERIKNSIRKNDFVARLGGDEFIIMMKDITKYNDILIEAEQLLKVIEEPIVIGYHTLYTSASLGISRYPMDAKSAENLLKYADTAMYIAKEEGGNNFQFYKTKMTDIAYEHVMMDRDLREGIKNGDFEVYYQPQFNVLEQTIVGMEALVRWHHPTVGMVAPDIFIPLSEKTGFIVELDLWVMKTAMSKMKRWHDAGLNPGKLSLNTAMKQLENPNIIQDIIQNLKIHNFKAEWLEIEITETEMMKKPKKIISILETLNELGISIAIDDFGTGYSSLSHLQRLPIDTLKIDKSFIADISNNDNAVVIVNTMITLAQSLNLSIVAEGVETEEQQNFLIDKGCHVIQGYYYSKPQSAKEIEKLLKKKI